MSAELVDPFAPAVEPLEEGEADRIAEAVKNEAWHDHGRYPEGFWTLFGVMRSIAEPGGTREWTQQEAVRVLRRVMRRVVEGEEQIEVNRHG
jgi:hypothetical protein